jgi:hypothetical protein
VAEFGIHRVEVDRNQIKVAGRCFSGRIAVGQVFRKAYPMEGDGPERGSMLIELTVERIMAYQHSLEEIDEGLTAELTLRGIGGDILADRWVLSDS